jgi:hypothetical protein
VRDEDKADNSAAAESDKPPNRPRATPAVGPLSISVPAGLSHFLERSKGLSGLDATFAHLRMMREMMPAILAGQQMAKLAASNAQLAKMLQGPVLSGLFIDQARIELMNRQSLTIAAPMMSAFTLQNQILSQSALLKMRDQLPTQVALGFLSPLSSITLSAESLYRRAGADSDLFRRIGIGPTVPANYVYAATRATASVVGDSEADLAALDESEDPEAEAGLDEHAAALAARLRELDPHLVDPLLAMHHALGTQGPDWVRAYTASGRQLLESTLQLLAPNSALESHFGESIKTLKKEERSKLHTGSAWTRRAQLSFIFRNLTDDDFGKMSENMMDIYLSLFFVANADVHSLKPRLTTAQARAVLHQVHASLETVLIASST